LTPQVVNRLEGTGRPDAESAILAGAGVAVLLYAFAISPSLLGGAVELSVWALIGFGIGALRAATMNLAQGAAVSASGKDQAAQGMAVLATFSTFSAPVGALAWSWSIQETSAPLTVAVSATLLLLALGGLTALQRRTYRRRAAG
jgi:hypothetical protein